MSSVLGPRMISFLGRIWRIYIQIRHGVRLIVTCSMKSCFALRFCPFVTLVVNRGITEPHAHIVHPLLSLALRFLLLIVSLCLSSCPFLPPSDQAHLPIEERRLEQPHLADFSTQVPAPFETAGSSTYAAPLPAEVTIPSQVSKLKLKLIYFEILK